MKELRNEWIIWVKLLLAGVGEASARRCRDSSGVFHCCCYSSTLLTFFWPISQSSGSTPLPPNRPFTRVASLVAQWRRKVNAGAPWWTSLCFSLCLDPLQWSCYHQNNHNPPDLKFCRSLQIPLASPLIWNVWVSCLRRPLSHQRQWAWIQSSIRRFRTTVPYPSYVQRLFS